MKTGNGLKSLITLMMYNIFLFTIMKKFHAISIFVLRIYFLKITCLYITR